MLSIHLKKFLTAIFFPYHKAKGAEILAAFYGVIRGRIGITANYAAAVVQNSMIGIA
jgi:hypothetical protein